MAGVPFESIEGLATCAAISMARKLAAKKAERAKAAAEAEKFFESRQRLLSPEAYQALRLAVRSERAPIAVSGEHSPATVEKSPVLRPNCRVALGSMTVNA